MGNLTPQEQIRLDAEWERVKKLQRKGQRRAVENLRRWQKLEAEREAQWKAAELMRQEEKYRRIKEEQVARSKEEKARNERKMVFILKRAAAVTERLVKGQNYEERMRRSRIRWDELIEDKYVVDQQLAWERCTTALEMRKAGLTFQKIGEHMSVCGSRAAQLVARAERTRSRYSRDHRSPVERYLSESAISPDILSIKDRRDVFAMKRTLEPFQFKPNRDWLLVDTAGAVAPG